MKPPRTKEKGLNYMKLYTFYSFWNSYATSIVTITLSMTAEWMTCHILKGCFILPKRGCYKKTSQIVRYFGSIRWCQKSQRVEKHVGPILFMNKSTACSFGVL